MEKKKIDLKDYYFPRKEMAQTVLKNIQSNDPHNMMLFKERRTGKTSFLRRDLIPESIDNFEKYKTVVIYFSFNTSTEKDFAKNFALNFYRTLSLTEIKNVINSNKNLGFKQKALNFLSFIKDFGNSVGLGFNLKFDFNSKEDNGLSLKEANDNELKLNISEIGFNFENKLKEKEKIDLDFDSLFYIFKKNYPDYKILLCLDEFQELAEYGNKKELTSKLRGAIDYHSDFVKAIFTGSSYNKLMSFFNDYNQPFYNFGYHLNLKDFDEEIFVNHILSVYFNNTQRLDVSKEEVMDVYLRTNKSPFYVTGALFNKQNDKDLKFMEEVNKLLLMDKNLLDKDMINKNFWSNLKPFEKMVVFRIVHFNGKLSTAESLNYFKEIWKMIYSKDLTDSQIRNKTNYAIKKLLQTERFIKSNLSFVNKNQIKNDLTLEENSDKNSKKDKNINDGYQLVDLKFREWFLNQSSKIIELMKI